MCLRVQSEGSKASHFGEVEGGRFFFHYGTDHYMPSIKQLERTTGVLHTQPEIYCQWYIV